MQDASFELLARLGDEGATRHFLEVEVSAQVDLDANEEEVTRLVGPYTAGERCGATRGGAPGRRGRHLARHRGPGALTDFFDEGWSLELLRQ